MRARHVGARSEHHVAWVVTAAFAAAGACWILVSDLILYAITRDRILVARLETAKGWLFVIFTSALIYWVALRGAARLRPRATDPGGGRSQHR